MRYLFLASLGLIAFIVIFRTTYYREDQAFRQATRSQILNTSSTATHTVTSYPSPQIIPETYVIPLRLHVFQTFNNCGPASMSMLLSYFNLNQSQAEIGQILRPWQHPQGDNDDKNVGMGELAQYARSLGLVAYHLPNGNGDKLMRLISRGLPVLIRTFKSKKEDIGHYRLVRGYDRTRRVFIQDDSLQNKNLEYTFDAMAGIWEPFNFEYLVVAGPEAEAYIKSILGAETNPEIAWVNSRDRLLSQLNSDPVNPYINFNLSVAYYNLKEYETAIKYYEMAETLLPRRMLWYQMEPIEAYYQTGNYTKVIEITDRILNDGNRGYSELYLLRAKIFLAEGLRNRAEDETEQALFYNRNYKAALDFLAGLPR